MDGPIFDNKGRQVATRVGNEVIGRDEKTRYDVDANGNLLDKQTGKIMGHLIPAGEYLPDGRPSPAQTLF